MLLRSFRDVGPATHLSWRKFSCGTGKQWQCHGKDLIIWQVQREGNPEPFKELLTEEPKEWDQTMILSYMLENNTGTYTHSPGLGTWS